MSKVVVDCLKISRDRLINEISDLRFDQLNVKPSSDVWSVAQICQHIFLTERAFTQAIMYGYKNRNSRKVQPQSIQIAADRSQKADAPQMVIPTDTPLELMEIVDMLDESRSIFLDFYSQIEDKSLLEEKSAKHPLFGYLPLDQWVELIYLHEERHLEQIKEVKLKYL